MGTLYPTSIAPKRLIGIADVNGSGTYAGVAYRGSRAITDRHLLNGAVEIISARTQHSCLFVLSSGHAMRLYHPNINYLDATAGRYKETDLRFTAADSYAHRIATSNYTLTTGNYPVASSITDTVKCKATFGSKYFQFWPTSLRWRTYDDESADYLSPLNYVAPEPVTRSTGIIQSEVLRYMSPFGGGTRLDYVPFPAYFRKELKLFNRYYPPIAIRGKSPDLEFVFSFTTNYLIYVDGSAFGLLAGDEYATTIAAIELRDGATVVSRLERPYAIDADGTRVACDYKISKVGSTYSITVCVPYAWWVNSVYPIIIDPEISYPADNRSGALAAGISQWADKDTVDNHFSFDQGAVGWSGNGEAGFVARSFLIFDTTGAPDFEATLFISGRIHGETRGSGYSNNAPTAVGIVWADFADDWKDSSSTYHDTWNTAKSITKDSASYQGIPWAGDYSIAFADGYFIEPLGLTKMALIIQADYENDVEPSNALTEISFTAQNGYAATYLEIIYEVDVIYPDSAHFESDTTFGLFRVFEPKLKPDSIGPDTEIGEPAIATLKPDSISGTLIGTPIIASIIITPNSIGPTVTFGTPIVNLLTVYSQIVLSDTSWGNGTDTVSHTLTLNSQAMPAYPVTVTDAVTLTSSAWDVQPVSDGITLTQDVSGFVNPAQADNITFAQTVIVYVDITFTVSQTLTLNSDTISYKD